MHTELFQQFGLAQNEARIYETLLREGELSVGSIATNSHVHRRNVYDSLNRLVEKGLVFEIIQKRESQYQAVDPHKLSEILQEKQAALDKVMPELESLYTGTHRTEEVYVYRGIEGLKNYMREVLRVGKDVHVIGAKAQLNSPKLAGIFPSFRAELDRRGIKYYNLYDPALKGTRHVGFIGEDCRFLPKDCATSTSIGILEDRVFFFSGISVGDFDENSSITIIVNSQIADAHRKWFNFIWSQCPKPKK